MLIYFDDSKKAVSYDKHFCQEVPEFRELIAQFGWDGFEVLALFADTRSFYRHLQGDEKTKQIIEDWNKKQKSKLVLTDVKVKSPIFQKAMEKYLLLNYDYLQEEYVVLEAEQRKDIALYRTPEEEPIREDYGIMYRVTKIFEEAGLNDAEIDDHIKQIKQWAKDNSEDDKKIAETRRIQRDNLKNAREQLEGLRAALFSKASKSGDTKMRLDAFSNRNKQ